MPAKTKIDRSDTDKIAVLRTERVPIDSIAVYDKNPRIGNIDKIAESLAKNKQYRGIVVNERDGKVLAGNHTLLAARRLGWEEILVQYVDVDDEEAKRIVLADNKTAELGTYDDTLLAELLAGLPSIEGTGFDAIEVDELLSGLDDIDMAIDSITGAAIAEQDVEARLRDMQTFDGSPLGEEPIPGAMPEGLPEPKGPTIEDAPDQLHGSVTFKPPDQMDLDGVAPWGITRLRDDMLMTFDELPDNLDSWAGSATKDWHDDEQWWLYNWGIDSTSGMKDISKVIVSFYAYDDYFINWWAYPDRYVSKLVNSKIKYMLTPDFSMATFMPPCEWLWQLHKSRFIGRYAQECGIKVIPTIEWPYLEIDFLRDHILSTLPHGLPMIALQMQTIDDATKDDPQNYIDALNSIFEDLEPDGALIYASPIGREILALCNTRATRIKVVGTRLEKLGEQQKGRQKKLTI